MSVQLFNFQPSNFTATGHLLDAGKGPAMHRVQLMYLKWEPGNTLAVHPYKAYSQKHLES